MLGHSEKMDKATAMRIVASLADGADPFSGKQLRRESVFQDVEVARGLFFALSAIRSHDPRQMPLDALLQKARSEEQAIWDEYCLLEIDPSSSVDLDMAEIENKDCDSEEAEDLKEESYYDDDEYVEPWTDPLGCGQYMAESDWRDILGDEQYDLLEN